jgi:hypothetical protein
MPYPEFPGDELAVKTLYKNISIKLEIDFLNSKTLRNKKKILV